MEKNTVGKCTIGMDPKGRDGFSSCHGMEILRITHKVGPYHL